MAALAAAGQAPTAPSTLSTPSVPSIPGNFATIRVSHYHLDLGFNFPAHQLTATAKVTFQILSPGSVITLLLNQNLGVKKVTDDQNGPLNFQRRGEQVLVYYPNPLTANQPQTLVMEYAGQLASTALSPISGLETAYVGPEGSFLLYPGEWFPMVGYNTDRFSMTVSATLPPPYGLLASGQATATPQPDNTVVYTWRETTPGFPGSVAITPLRPQTYTLSGLTSNFYFAANTPPALLQQYANSAAAIAGFINERVGTPPTNTLIFVELPNNSLPSYSSPGLIFLTQSSVGTTLNYRLLTDEIAQQWFGNLISPATLNDSWIQYGAARFFEALYVEQLDGQEAYQTVIRDFAVGALSYPQTALAQTATLYPFSPAYQDLTYDKGAMLFHMLRWQLGDQHLFTGLRQFVAQYANQPVTTAELQQSLEAASGTSLNAFFAEWYRGTESPTFHNQYTVYRLYQGGFRIVGQLKQNLNLFAMPVEIRVLTDGKPVNQRIEVEGRNSPYSIATADRPRNVQVDPHHWLLINSPEIQLRVEIARGDNQVAAGNFPGAIRHYEMALKINPISSLAHYRIAEADYQEQNWQGAADQYRDALGGDLRPEWIRVWSHIQLGKIFDLTGQRDRAVHEYERALQTHDNTDGALSLAREYLKTPYKQARASA